MVGLLEEGIKQSDPSDTHVASAPNGGDEAGSLAWLPLLMVCAVPVAILWRAAARRRKRRRFAWQQGDPFAPADAENLIQRDGGERHNPFPLSVDLSPPSDPSEADRFGETQLELWLGSLAAAMLSAGRGDSVARPRYERAAAR